MRRLVLWLFLAAGSTACAPTPAAPPSAAPAAAANDLTRYLPLENDTVFSYATYIEETNERGLAVFEIKRPRPELAELSLAGQVRKRYYFEPGGVRSAQGGYLLKLPLQQNAEWPGDDGIVKVTSVNLSVDVPAGKFSGCIQTVEDARLGAATRKTTTVFCPGIGITVLEINAEQEGTSVLQRLSLKAFGPRFKAP
ncbi:MAG TPA: hypothetical protein VER96_35330 [Polyangiaceae bacterium]|nr:hypothetical protein [Polyangiaceae bacterium]